jgi:hypothetical protein
VRPLALDDLCRCGMSAHGPIMITPIVRLVSVTIIVVRKVLWVNRGIRFVIFLLNNIMVCALY